MFASARPSSFGNVRAAFDSVNVFPKLVVCSTFMPKSALQLDA
jgi:hypothetical protein